MSLLDVLLFSPRNKIGDIEIAAALEEIHTDNLQTTEHPVEAGAAISDHAYIRPQEVLIKCGWSNSTLDSIISAASNIVAGEMSASNYIDSVYQYLLGLQRSLVPFDITTSKRQYSNMLIVGLTVATDSTTSAALMVTAHCRQVIIVKTQATTLPAKEDQADPSKTAGVENTGVKQVKPAEPMQGGVISPGGM